MTKIDEIRSDIKSVAQKISAVIEIISAEKSDGRNVGTIDITGLRTELKSISEKVSDLAKTIALSTLAMSWLLLIGGKDSPSLPQPPDKIVLVFTIICSVLSLVAAYFQYVFAYASSKTVHDEAERLQKNITSYNPKSVLFKLRTWMFWAKQGLAGLSVMLLFSVLLMALT
jgi:hypothetical protein